MSALDCKRLDVDVTARAAIVMNGDTGAILYAKEEHLPCYPASTTKVATALFILDHKKPPFDQPITVAAEALKIRPLNKEDVPAYWGAVDGTKMGLVKGEVVSVDALLHGLMLISGNDAANALAASLSESIPQFMQEMNRYLLELGCRHTRFCNPHGLHHPEHITTAYDMCLITKRALQIPKFREVVSTRIYHLPKTNKRPPSKMKHTNALLNAGPYHYPKSIGVKTGYHSQAMTTLVAAAEHKGRTLIAVLLGCPTRGDRYKDAIRLFEAAFAEQPITQRLFDATQRFARVLPNAKTPLQAHLAAPLTISYYPAEEPSCKALLHWDVVPLPIHKEQKVGAVHIYSNQGNLIAKGDLVAQDEVIGTFFFRMKERIRSLFATR